MTLEQFAPGDQDKPSSVPLTEYDRKVVPWTLDLLEMCFPYGTKAEEGQGRGRGKKARTVVELIREVRQEEVSEITMRICDERREREAADRLKKRSRS